MAIHGPIVVAAARAAAAMTKAKRAKSSPALHVPGPGAEAGKPPGDSMPAAGEHPDLKLEKRHPRG